MQDVCKWSFCSFFSIHTATIWNEHIAALTDRVFIVDVDVSKVLDNDLIEINVFALTLQNII